MTEEMQDESLAEYRERWYNLLPAKETAGWSTGATPSDLQSLADSVTECTCDTMLLMRAGCQCGRKAR